MHLGVGDSVILTFPKRDRKLRRLASEISN